jgi:hypothetical protein
MPLTTHRLPAASAFFVLKWINDEKHTDHHWIAENIEGGLRAIAASLKK